MNIDQITEATGSRHWNQKSPHAKRYVSSLPDAEGVIKQKGFFPGGTSVSQVPAGVSRYLEIIQTAGVEPEDGRFLRNLDYGGGRYNLGKYEFRKLGINSQIYDLYSRSEVHNKRIKSVFKGKPADTVTLFNVLNVVKKDEQAAIISSAMKLLRSGGVMIIDVYEADKRGITTKKTYQEAKPLGSYVPVIEDAAKRKVHSMRVRNKTMLYVIK